MTDRTEAAPGSGEGRPGRPAGSGAVRVVVGGASGYVGRALAASLSADGHEVVALSRGPARASAPCPAVAWEQAASALEGADAVVNLAGETIGAPFWTARRKAAIRVEPD